LALTCALPAVADTEFLTVHSPSLGAANLRAGPGTGHSVVTELRHGTLTEQVSQEGSWYEIAQRGQTIGWMHKNFVKSAGITQTRAPIAQVEVTTSTCADPMTLDQTRATADYLRKLLQTGDIRLLLDRCRTLTLTSQRHGPVSGKLHDLALELNPAWTKVAYFGLRTKQGVFASGNVITAQHDNTADTADWLITYQAHRSKLMWLAGYDKDPMAALNKSLAADFEALLGTPKLAASLSTAGQMPARDAQAIQSKPSDAKG